MRIVVATINRHLDIHLQFDNLLLMDIDSSPALEKQAIDAAIKENWEEAIKLNLEILEKAPNNLKAKVRLGRAYLQTKDFTKAKNIFKEVLKQDPINQVAKKNYELASKKVADLPINKKASIKEPGTYKKVELEVSTTMAKNLSMGQELQYTVLKNSIKVSAKGNQVGNIEDTEVISALRKAEDIKTNVHLEVIKVVGNKTHIGITTQEPVFKPEKQDVKPFVKKGSIDEPEIEIPEMEE